MNLRCGKCNIIYKLSDSRVPDRGTKVKCPRCDTIYRIKKKAYGQHAATVEGSDLSTPVTHKDATVQTNATNTELSALNDKEQKERIYHNHLALFETDLKKLQSLIFIDKYTNETITKAKDAFMNMMSSYKDFKKDITNKDKTIKELETLLEK